MSARAFNGSYRGAHLAHFSFPLSGIGAGMRCLEGSGALGSISVRNKPALQFSPMFFAALCLRGRYHAVDKTLYLAPPLDGDCRAFLCPATGYGTVEIKHGKPFLDVRDHHIHVQRIIKT